MEVFWKKREAEGPLFLVSERWMVVPTGALFLSSVCVQDPPPRGYQGCALLDPCRVSEWAVESRNGGLHYC